LLLWLGGAQKANFGGDFDSTQNIPDHANHGMPDNVEEFADDEGEEEQDLL